MRSAGGLPGLFGGRRLLNVLSGPGAGRLTPAHPPIPVTAELVGQGWGDTYSAADAYALAWSREAVLVLIWFPQRERPGRPHPVLLWVEPSGVTRRQSGASPEATGGLSVP